MALWSSFPFGPFPNRRPPRSVSSLRWRGWSDVAAGDDNVPFAPPTGKKVPDPTPGDKMAAVALLASAGGGGLVIGSRSEQSIASQIRTATYGFPDFPGHIGNQLICVDL